MRSFYHTFLILSVAVGIGAVCILVAPGKALVKP